MQKDVSYLVELIQKQNPSIPQPVIGTTIKIIHLLHDFYVNSMVQSSKKNIKDIYSFQLKAMEKTGFFSVSEVDVSKEKQIDSQVLPLNMPLDFNRIGIHYDYTSVREEMFTKNTNFNFSSSVFFFTELQNGSFELKISKKIINKIWQLSMYRVILPHDFLNIYLTTGEVLFEVLHLVDGGEGLIPEATQLKIDIDRAINSLVLLANKSLSKTFTSKVKFQKISRSVLVLY